MSEAGDYSPGVWKGHDFDSAKSSYRSYANTSYSKAVSSGKTLKDLVPEKLKTESENPVVIFIDQTGSMHEWPSTIFSKLPYLEHEAKTEYMGKDVEFSFAAFGDARNNEEYPFQARPFSKSTEIAKRLKELVIEGNGGGQTYETPEYGALYYARNIEMPNAIRPLFIVISDESPYDYVLPDLAKDLTHVDLKERMSTKKVFDELKQRFSVYFVQKPYDTDHFTEPMTGTTKRVHKDWAELVGEDHIAPLADPGRVVDVIFGIMAREAGKIGYFRDEIEDRQKPEQVEAVYEALQTIHTLPGGKAAPKLLPGRSVTRRPKKD